MTDREKQIFLIAQDFGMRLMLQAALRTNDCDELQDLAGAMVRHEPGALGLKYDHDPACWMRSTRRCGARCQSLPGRRRTAIDVIDIFHFAPWLDFELMAIRLLERDSALRHLKDYLSSTHMGSCRV